MIKGLFGIIIISLLLFFNTTLIFAQCPTAGFTIPSTICKGENVPFTNTSVNASSYSWDACSGDLAITPTLTTAATPSLSTASGISIVSEGNNWYGFISSTGNNKIFRLDFGTSLENTPTVVDLGNIGSALVSPESIKMIKEGGNWYGILTGGSPKILMRLNFGSDITNTTPTVDNLLTLNCGRGDMIVQQDGGEYILVVANYNTNSINLVNFHNSITNNPTVSDTLNSGKISGANGLKDISVIKECDKWYGIAVGYNSRSIHRIEFGTSLYSRPSPANGVVLSVSPLPSDNTFVSGVEVVQEGGNVYALVMGYVKGRIYRLDFGNSITNTAILNNLGNLGSLANIYSLAIANAGTEWYGFTNNLTTNRIYRISFPNTCSSNQPMSTDASPVISYSQAGTYNITLTAKNNNESTNSITKSITVSSDDAPLIDFSSQNKCVSVPVDFTSNVINGQAITSWTWDFGDPSSGASNTSNVQNPSHQFSSSGTYSVKLLVQNSLGCSNSLTKQISIYDPTISNFDIPSGTICSNQSLIFQNTSTGETGSAVIWSWEFIRVSNNEIVGTSDSKDGSFTFTSGDSYKARLTSGVDGCNSVLEKTFTVVEGPIVDFSYTNNCFLGSTVQFNNLSSNIVNNNWEIRKSDNTLLTSSNTGDFSYQFPDVGDYTVKLVAENSGGCSNSVTKSITVSNNDLIDIQPSTFVENVVGTFTGVDLTNSNDDILTWSWDFDGLGTATGKDVSFTFPNPISYNIKLSVTTSQGCSQMIEKVITVQPAKCPSADFNIPLTVCQNENFTFVNTSVNGSSYLWDACSGDLTGTPILTTTATPSLSFASGISIVSDGNNWYGFISSTGNDKIFRLDFGSSLNNTPTIVDLGNIGGALISPESIKIISEGGNWYGILTNGSPKSLTRLNFGNDITNSTPSVETLLTLDSNRGDMAIGQDEGNYVVIVSNYNTNKLNIINFYNSITNNPTVSDTLNSSVIAGANGLKDISIIKECDKWYGIAVGYNSRSIHRIEFGTSLYSRPSPANGVVLSVSPLPSDNTFVSGVEVVQEGGNVYALVMGYFTGRIYRLDFGNSITNTAVLNDLGNLGSLANIYSLAIANAGTEWYGFTNNLTTNRIYRISFPNTCSSNQPISTDASPVISYSQAGTYNITLTVKDPNGNRNSISKQINVSNNEAPQASFVSPKECISSPVDYTATVINGQTITSWSWDFNDPGSGVNNTSSLQNPSHQFSAAGVYRVKLVVTSDNGCSNTIIKYDTIYSETNPDFIAPSGLLCSNAPLLFSNSSTQETGPHVRWLWDFGDGQTDTAKVPTHTYANGGSYTVTLTAGVEGCSNTISKQITVIQGPQTGFTFQNICLGETTIFSDTTKGDGLTQWEWDFGDGNTSTVRSPNNAYMNPGTYNVSLKVTNQNGCEVIKSVPITIYSNPEVDFTYGLLCNSDSVEFVDHSTLADGNITDWRWQVYDQQSNLVSEKSGTDRAKFLLAQAGQYFISLTATSERGCSSFKTTQVEILPSPQVDIVLNELCVGDSVMIDGVELVENQDIVAWKWTIDNGPYFDGQHIKYKFGSAGTYQISLIATSGNGCETFLNKSFTLYEKPNVGFTYLMNCEDTPVQFTDTTNVSGDIITQWSWDFGGLGSSTEQNPTFTFDQSGMVEVTLTATTSHNCAITSTQQVNITPLPIADFSFSPEVGPPPLAIDFTNTSSNSTSFHWNFGTEAESTEISPHYTFTELGDYTIELVAMNNEGCSDTTRKKISIQPPSLSIVLENILVSTLTEELSFAVDIKNTGTKIVNSIEFIVDFGGKLSFKEVWSGSLNPGAEFSYMLTNQLIKEELSKVKYLCITARDLNNEQNSLTTKLCTNLEDKFMVFDLTPNPARSEVYLSYILPEKKMLEVNFYNIKGDKISFSLPDFEKGFNESLIDLSRLSPGMYLVEFVYDKQKVKKKLLVY